MEYRLEELFDLQMGKTPSRSNSEYWGTDENKWISIADLSKCGKYIYETKECLSDIAVAESGISQIPAETVVMSFKLSIGKTAITPEPMYSNEAIMSFRDKHVVDLLPEYVYYLLLSHDWDEGTNKAVMGKTLNKATLSKVKVRIHSYNEQQEIISVLNTASTIIGARQQELQKLDELIKARFVEMFGAVDKKMPISAVCDVSGGYSFKSGDISSDGAVKILQIGNVYLDDVNWETTNYLPDGFDITFERFLLHEGDIVIALTRPIIQSLGNVKACIVKKSDTPCLLNQRVGRIVPKEHIDVNLKFIYGCLMTEDFTRYVENCCIGCSQPNISTKDVENYMIPDVSYECQMEFVKFREQVDKSKVVVQAALDKAQLLFDSLMQEYFG